jgi:RNA polymerase sigma-70 factor, ECF subfamily
VTPPAAGGPPEAELVRQAADGDRRALESLLGSYHDRIHLICLRMCRHRQDADDATQEALIAVVRGLPRFDGRSAFSTWVYRVATNACLDELRRRRRRPDPVAAEDRPDLADHASAEDPADGAVRAETRDALLAALADLPEDFRAPVVLRDVLDLDYAEIAEVLELPGGTVRSRIARGRARLAATLEGPFGNQDHAGGVGPIGSGGPPGPPTPTAGTPTSTEAPP